MIGGDLLRFAVDDFAEGGGLDDAEVFIVAEEGALELGIVGYFQS